MVHWLGLGTFTAKGVDLIPGWVTKSLQATQHSLRYIDIYISVTANLKR